MRSQEDIIEEEWRPKRRHTPGVKPILRGFIILSVLLFVIGLIVTLGVWWLNIPATP